MNRRSSLLLAARLLVAAAAPALAVGAPARASGITPEMRREDPRLEKRVTVLMPCATLPQAVEELSRQGGVPLSLSPSLRDQASQLRVCVLLRDQPLGSALDALYSLLSYRNATCNWVRSGQADGGAAPYAYELRGNPAALAALRDEVRRQAQREFEAQSDILRGALDMPEEKLRELAKTNSDAAHLLAPDASIAKRYRGGLRAFFSLPPAQQRQVLEGQAVHVPIDSLPGEGVEFAEQEMSRVLGGARQPRTVTFLRDGNSITPCLMIQAGDASAGNYIGGPFTEDAFRRRLGSNWLLRDDKAGDGAEDKDITAPAKAAPLPKSDPNDPLAAVTADVRSVLWQASEAASVPIIAVLPSPFGQIVSALPDPTKAPPYGKTLGKWLNDMATAPGFYNPLSHKWRDGILLIRDASAPFR